MQHLSIPSIQNKSLIWPLQIKHTIVASTQSEGINIQHDWTINAVVNVFVVVGVVKAASYLLIFQVGFVPLEKIAWRLSEPANRMK